MAECVGDIGRFDGVPLAVVWMGVVVAVDGRVGGDQAGLEVSQEGQAPEEGRLCGCTNGIGGLSTYETKP